MSMHCYIAQKIMLLISIYLVRYRVKSSIFLYNLTKRLLIVKIENKIVEKNFKVVYNYHSIYK